MGRSKGFLAEGKIPGGLLHRKDGLSDSWLHDGVGIAENVRQQAVRVLACCCSSAAIRRVLAGREEG